MGGQACVLYGGAEFSRDVDLAIEPSEGNLTRVREALERLSAERVFAPELSLEALDRGHACHFRAGAEGASGIRIDLMSRMRGCDAAHWLPLERELEAMRHAMTRGRAFRA